MNFKEYIHEIVSSGDAPKLNETDIGNDNGVGSSTQQYSNDEYWNILDEDTGFRYNIPMLDTISPSYYYDYIYYMKLKEQSPTTFNKLLTWD